MRVLAQRSRAVVLAATMAAAAGANPAAGQGLTHQSSVDLTAVYRHFGNPLGPSLFTNWGGKLDVTFVQDTFGGTLTLPLGLGDRACRLSSRWSLPPPPTGFTPTTGPLEMCLAKAAASASDVETWIHGGTASDPALTAAMTPSGSNIWTNAAPFDAQMLVRDCRPEPDPDLGPVPGTVRAVARTVHSTGQRVGSLLSLPPNTQDPLAPTTAVTTRPSRPFVRLATVSLPSASLTLTLSPTTGLISLSATSASLASFDATVWGQIRQECGNAKVDLPAQPPTGTLSVLSGPPAAPGGAGSTRPLRGMVVRDAEAALLVRADAAVLVEELDQADDDLALALPSRGIEDVEEFVTLIDTMVSQGRMTTAVAAPLRGTAQEIILVISDRTRPPSERPEDDAEHTVCAPRLPCVPTILHVAVVGDGFVIAPDGSEAHPYPTITDALERFEELIEEGEACGIEIVVHGGFYRENLEIRHNTFIRHGGERRASLLHGSIRNSTLAELKLEGIFIWDSDRPGAIVVDHPCAVTDVDDVDILNAEHYGIWQRGGLLNVSRSDVFGTRAGPTLVSQGTGIYLTGGVRADLGSVIVSGNDSGGIIAQGEGTEMIAANVYVQDNTVNAFFVTPENPCLFAEGMGGVLARFGAVIRMNDSLVEGNTSFGLIAVGEGTEIEFSGAVDSTRSSGDSCFGNNVLAIFDAHVTLHDFSSFKAEVCGLQLAAGGEIDASHGNVFDNIIGANVQTEGFDLDRIQDDVRYLWNESNFDGSTLPLPEALGEV